jgi:SAM-dependent methyltransferase
MSAISRAAALRPQVAGRAQITTAFATSLTNHGFAGNLLPANLSPATTLPLMDSLVAAGITPDSSQAEMAGALPSAITAARATAKERAAVFLELTENVGNIGADELGEELAHSGSHIAQSYGPYLPQEQRAKLFTRVAEVRERVTLAFAERQAQNLGQTEEDEGPMAIVIVNGQPRLIPLGPGGRPSTLSLGAQRGPARTRGPPRSISLGEMPVDAADKHAQSAIALEEKARELFLAAHPNPGPIQRNYFAAGFPLSQFALSQFMQIVFINDSSQWLDHNYSDLSQALIDIYHDAERNPKSKAGELVSLIAESASREYVAQHIADRESSYHALPENPYAEGDYWDLATGPNGQGLLLAGLSERHNYRFIDSSLYSVALLREAVKELRRENFFPASKRIEIEQADILRLAPPKEPLAAIRAKNVNVYVPGLPKAMERMADWLAPGGQFIIQTDDSPGQRQRMVEDYEALARDLTAQGWILEYSFSSEDQSGFDTLTLTRPKPGVTPQSRRTWRDFANAVEKHDRDSYNPMARMLRMFGR